MPSAADDFAAVNVLKEICLKKKKKKKEEEEEEEEEEGENEFKVLHYIYFGTAPDLKGQYIMNGKYALQTILGTIWQKNIQWNLSLRQPEKYM